MGSRKSCLVSGPDLWHVRHVSPATLLRLSINTQPPFATSFTLSKCDTLSANVAILGIPAPPRTRCTQAAVPFPSTVHRTVHPTCRHELRPQILELEMWALASALDMIHTHLLAGQFRVHQQLRQLDQVCAEAFLSAVKVLTDP